MKPLSASAYEVLGMKDRFQHNPSGQTVCRRCESSADEKVVTFSIHTAIFSTCAGGGDVIHLAIPWCRQCDTEPTDSGCIHTLDEMVATAVNLPPPHHLVSS